MGEAIGDQPLRPRRYFIVMNRNLTEIIMAKKMMENMFFEKCREMAFFELP